jgi:hypothetical protein
MLAFRAPKNVKVRPDFVWSGRSSRDGQFCLAIPPSLTLSVHFHVNIF